MPFKPNREVRRCVRIEWSMVSKAAVRSMSSHFLSHGLDNVVVYRKKRGFSGMVGYISRLKSAKVFR